MKKLLVILSVGLAISYSANAQMTNLVNFNYTNGSNPYGDVLLSGANLYGMTSSGAADVGGNVFSVDTTGSNFVNMYNFLGGTPNGDNPYFSQLLQVGNKFYGTTTDGGIANEGNIFSIDTNGTGYKDLYDFTGTNGEYPEGGLYMVNGKLYGVTNGGGANYAGLVFSMDTNGSNYTDMADFNYSNGAYPVGSLIMANGKLYGTTSSGGLSNEGNIFSIDTNGNSITDMADFTGANGSNSYASLTLYNGKLYGTTNGGGTNYAGTIFNIDTNGNTINDLWNFQYEAGVNGAYPYSGVTISGGVMYGSTYLGGTGYDGNVYQIDTDGTRYMDLMDCNGSTGIFPYGGVTLLGSKLYGMAINGGLNSDGTIYTLDTGTNGGSAMYNFANIPDGAYPNASFVFTNGKLYGMTEEGGAYNNSGTIISIDTNGTQDSVLYSFGKPTSNIGDEPQGNLIRLGKKLYGMTSNMGLDFDGNIFSMDTAGNNVTNVWSFNDTGSVGNANGANPYGSLLLLGGKFYGMTSGGGAYREGNIFSIDTNGGNYTDLYDFNYTYGGYPNGSLIYSSGKFYGMTNGGGANSAGVVFCIDSNGANYKDQWDFSYSATSNGAEPDGSLTIIGGNLYGMTSDGGAYREGNIFSIDTNGSNYTDMLDFAGNNGEYPNGSLTLVGGKFYGMADGGGMYGDGIIFNMDTNGADFNTLYNFADAGDGSSPEGDITYFKNTLYGMTQGGGTGGNGVVFAFPLLNVITIDTVNVTCVGGASGSATASVSGGVSPYTYLWNDANSQTTATATGLVAGTYTVYIWDNNGVPDSASVSISQPDSLSTVTISAANITCNGGTVSATANVSGGTTPYTYAWSDAGSQNTATATGLSAGTYSVSVKDACGADSLSKTITISQPDSLSTVTISAANITCNGGTVSATANVSGGTTPYTYLWSNGEATATATGLVAGTYSVSVKDACGADSLSKTITITQPSPLGNVIASVTSNIICNGTNSGSAMVSSPSGGTTPYTYMWSDASSQNTATATGLSAGTYNVSVMDNCGTDSVSATITITQPAALGVETSISQVISCNGTNGDLVATVSGGNTPYTYTWTPSGGNASGATVTAGTYTITVNDGCGATATSSIILTQPVGITSTGSVTQEVGCNGGNNGIASVSASGGDTPYTYTWSDANSQSTASATGLVAGTYTVNITDPCEDEASSVVIISQPAAISVVATISGEVTCYMSTNGSASSSVSGGATPYTYSWSGSAGRTNATVSGLGAGTYILTITDANGCSQTSNVITITQPSTSIETSASTTTNVLCNGENSGSATSSATGGTTPYTYAWTGGGGSNAVASNLIAGNYTVTITDNGGCSSSASIVISQPSTSLGATTYSTQTAQGACDGTAAVTASGGVTPYTYLWNNPGTSTTDTIKNQCFGTFCCEITDANGCTASICVQVDTINTTGINSITNANNINIYPNPTIGSFTIAGVTQGQVIELYNYIGEKISSTVVSNNTTMHFDISNRANGVYMIRILNTDGTLATEKKMIKTQ